LKHYSLFHNTYNRTKNVSLQNKISKTISLRIYLLKLYFTIFYICIYLWLLS